VEIAIASKIDRQLARTAATADLAIEEVAKKADSLPPVGFKKVTNFYVDPSNPNNIRLRIEYEN